MTQYQFRREDTGEVIDVDFATMMEAKDGFLEIEPGVFAKRINRHSVKRSVGERGRTEIVSDALGFPRQQMAEMEDHRQLHNHTDIEFVPDPEVPEFIQVKCGSEKAKHRYMESRGFTDQNSRNGSGQVLSPNMLEHAREIVNRER
ncbi:MAG: hypothetical protein AAFV88_04340 [Planctomycetota bacterium]